MQNTQPKFKWHNEVIAWLNGEIIEWKRSSEDHWTETSMHKDPNGLPHSYIYNLEYRIKPKEVIKWAGIYEHGPNDCGMSESVRDSISEVISDSVFKDLRISKTKFQKRTYLNGELIALELVKV